MRSTPPTDEYAKRRVSSQLCGDKNSDFVAISLFFRKTATNTTDLNPFMVVADFQQIDPSNERQNIPSFWISFWEKQHFTNHVCHDHQPKTNQLLAISHGLAEHHDHSLWQAEGLDDLLLVPATACATSYSGIGTGKIDVL